MKLAAANAFDFNFRLDSMKPTTAKESARRAAQAKVEVAAKATEDAQAKRDAAKLQKSRSSLEKKLSCALLMAAAEDASKLVWKGDPSVLTHLNERGLWVYEQGIFSQSDVVERLKEWRQHSLDAAMLKWIANPKSKIHLADKKAVSKLFGGSEGFASLHEAAWENFFERIGKEDDFWLLRESSDDPYEYEDYLISSFVDAWKRAVRRREIDPSVSSKSFYEYEEIYGGDMLNQFRQEARRSANGLHSALEADRCIALHLADDDSVRFEGLDELKFDYVNCVIEHLAGDWPALFRIDKILCPMNDQKMEGGILHPSIFRYYEFRKGVDGRLGALSDVESLEIFWTPVQRDWLPFDDTVDEKLLNWLGGRDGKRFRDYVFDRVESAAQDGLTQVELELTQFSACWTLADDDEISRYSLPPTLLSSMLSGYGYKVKASSAGKKCRVVITW